MPEIAQLQDNETRRKQLDDRARDLRVAVDDLTAEQRKADADVEQVKARRERDRSRMDQGLITDPKDLERMGHELESLERRITSLEDTELEVMERLEETQTELEKVTSELAGFEERTPDPHHRPRPEVGRHPRRDHHARARARRGGRGPAGRPDGALRAAPGAEERRGCCRPDAAASAVAAGSP